MPDYLQLTDLNGQIPPQFIIQALDDDNDGVIDAWDAVREAVQSEIDAALEGRFVVPLTFSPMPRIINRAAVALACEMCYRRRGTADAENPWKGRADAFRKKLEAINMGDMKMASLPDTDAAVVDPPASIITVDSGLGAPGRLLG
ncbi:phage protein Gp36 family protein [Prosthecobacter sp.]|uniref:phage protein Gp36 family protein n=1 Tax=Prosthecobacter sp. TaxID=1965333 RepID=UPI003783C8A9